MIRPRFIPRAPTASMKPWTPAARPGMVALLAAAVLFGVLTACDDDPVAGDPPGSLAVGTWGGDDAGIIVSEAMVHVHIGCTNGYFPGPVLLDDGGRFSVPGEYVLDAYPVQLGPRLPARFAGVVEGRELTFTVAVDDTVHHELVVEGPVTVVLGVEPMMGPCPICESSEQASAPTEPEPWAETVGSSGKPFPTILAPLGAPAYSGEARPRSRPHRSTLVGDPP